jgi:hypothetical protein
LETFVGNAGILTAFGNSGATTLEITVAQAGQYWGRVEMPSGACPALCWPPLAAGSKDEKLGLICSRNLAFAHHFPGNPATACRHTEIALGYSRRAIRPVRLITSQVDHQLAMQTLMATEAVTGTMRGYSGSTGWRC